MKTKKKLGLLSLLIVKIIIMIILVGLTGEKIYIIIITTAMFITVLVDTIILWGEDPRKKLPKLKNKNKVKE